MPATIVQVRPMIDSFCVLREKIRETRYLEYAILIFIAGFFLAWNTRIHRDIYYFAVLIPFLLIPDSKVIRTAFRTPVFLFFLAFIIYMLMTMLWSPNLDIDAVYDRFRYAFLSLSFILVVAFLSYRDTTWVCRLAMGLTPFAIVTLVASVFLFYGDGFSFPRDRLLNMLFYRDNPLRGSLPFGVLAVLCGACLMRPLPSSWRTVLLVGLPISFVFLMLAQSRGQVLGIFLALVLCIILDRRWLWVIVLMGFAVLVVAMTQTSAGGMNGFLDRADSHRLELWTIILERAMHSPWLGEGIETTRAFQLGNRVTLYSTHNIWLTVFLFGGIAGVLTFGAMVAVSLREALRVGIVNHHWVPFCLMIFGLTHLFFNGNHPISRIDPDFYLALFLPVGLLVGSQTRRLLDVPDS